MIPSCVSTSPGTPIPSKGTTCLFKSFTNSGSCSTNACTAASGEDEAIGILIVRSGVPRRSNAPRSHLMAGSYYNNPYFLDQQFREFKSFPDMYVFHAFLFYNPDIQPKSITELPLTRYFGSPTGIMIARTGWDEGIDLNSSTVIAEMRIGEYQYNNHQHLDAGSFQLYYKGYLAIDSGIYKGTSGNYHSPHNKYYFKRTIAHNSLLVYDPDELKQYPYIKDGGQVWPNVNDGGQRWPNEGRPSLNLDDLLNNDFKRGEVLAHYYGSDQVKPEFSYLKGDITAAYSSKMKQFQRSFVFLNFMDTVYPAAGCVSEPRFQEVLASTQCRGAKDR
jgi:hypothetical protein